MEETKRFIKELNLSDVFTTQNFFKEKYGCDIFLYIRVSTEKQDYGRQLLEAREWCLKKNITICIDNIYCETITGKSKHTDRLEYSKIKERAKKGDYILISEISRLGRNWDNVKREWYDLKAKDLNILVQDFNDLSSPLPEETKEMQTTDKKFIQELIFNGVLYAACKKIEEVSKSTKAGMKKAQMNGVVMGRPTSLGMQDFMTTLKYIIDNKVGFLKGCLLTRYPHATFSTRLAALRDISGYYEYKDIYQVLIEYPELWGKILPQNKYKNKEEK